MKKLLLCLPLLLAGCFDNEDSRTLTQEILVQMPKYTEPKCFLYPTYPTYQIVGGDGQSERFKKVWIVIYASPSTKMAKYETLESGEKLKIYGYFVETFNGEFQSSHNWFSATDIEKLQVTDCSNFGKITKREVK